MEGNSYVDILKCPSNLEEIIAPLSNNIIKYNTFPLRIRKSNEVRVFTVAGNNGLIHHFNWNKTECENSDGGNKSAIRTEDDTVLCEGEFPETPCCSKLLQNSNSSQNIKESHNFYELQPTRKSLSCKTNENFPSSLSDAHQSPLNENGRGTETFPMVINVDRAIERSTDYQEVIETSMHDSHQHIIDRNANSHSNTSRRLPATPTQIQIDSLNNVQLSTQVEEALGIINHFKPYQPTIGSTVFSIIMTILFVGMLWVVVFIIFGPKGHAIAAIFLSIFILGFLLNTCFLKFYFRLGLLFGIDQLGEQRLQSPNLASLQQQREDEVRQQRAMEPPPSYLSVMESPPPYSVAKNMKITKPLQTEEPNRSSSKQMSLV